MELAILKLIIWPKNEKKNPRVIGFKPGMVNLITGASRTGKSALIEIVDYCLGSSKCSIPGFGPIRRSAAWYGLLVQTVEGQKLMARRDPEDQEATDDYYLAEGVNLQIPSHIAKNTTRDSVKGLLTRLCELPQMSFDYGQTGSGSKTRPTFSDMTSFVFQPQSVIANKNVMFYEASDAEHAKKLREVFPLALGAIDSDLMVKLHRLADARRDLERLKHKMEMLKSTFQDFAGEIRSRYVAAIQLGVLAGDISDLDNTDITTILRRLRDLCQTWSDEPFSRSRDSLYASSERLSELRRKHASINSELAALRVRLLQLRELSMARSMSESTIGTERDRLAPVSWLSGRLTADTCPLCGGPNHAPSSELDKLKRSVEEVENLWEGIEVIPPMLDAEETEVRRQIEALDHSAQQIRLEIQGIERETNDDRNRKEREAVFMGRLEQFLEAYDSSMAENSLSSDIGRLEDEIAELQGEVDPSSISQRKETALFQVSRFAQEYGSVMGLESGSDLIQLDTSKLTIKVINPEGRATWLDQIGSGANWLGYHVAALLALHELFIRQSVPYVPNLLIVDQPSQTQFPDDTDEESQVEEIAAVANVFKAFSLAIEKTRKALQIIVTDHAGGRAISGITHVHICERWRAGRKLIPWHWDQGVLQESIGRRADAAADDLIEEVLRPAIARRLGLDDDFGKFSVKIRSAIFSSKGICFELDAVETERCTSVRGVVDDDLTVSFDGDTGV